MRKIGIATLFVLISAVASAQFYVSGSGGYSIPSAGMKLGETISASGVENYYGSYGEGLHAQLRAGYFFNEKFGTEISLGYLHGSDQTINKVEGLYALTGNEVDVIARGRAYGLSASFVYKFTNNIYGRFGGLIKVGGKTEAVGYRKQNVSGLPIPGAPAGITFPDGSYAESNFVLDYKGRLPLGFVGAIGYKYDVTNSIAIFGELEYMGVSVTRDKAIFNEFKTEIVTPDGNRTVVNTLDNLPQGYSREIKFVDELTLAEQTAASNNPFAAKQLSQKVPYSSFGINFGVTFTLGGGNSSKNTQANN